jgi:sugar lactone lactonase YvrE
MRSIDESIDSAEEGDEVSPTLDAPAHDGPIAGAEAHAQEVAPETPHVESGVEAHPVLDTHDVPTTHAVLSTNGEAEQIGMGIVGAAERSEPDKSPQADVPVPNRSRPRPNPVRRAGAFIAQSWLWRSRGFWLGAVGLGLALYGQKLVTVDRQIVESIRWYGMGIIVMLIAWLGTYKNKVGMVVPVVPAGRSELATTLPTRSGSRRSPVAQPVVAQLPAPRVNWWSRFAPVRRHSSPGASLDARHPFRERWRALTTRFPFIAWPWPRYLLAAAALAVNLWCASQIRQDYFSVGAGWGWFLSMVLLVLAFVGERKRPVRDLDRDAEDVEERTDMRLPRRIEFWLVAAIFALAVVFRFYRLGDWFTGMHGDEGEAGMDAIRIMEGGRVSIFETGWFAQPNFYYYGIARVMDIFGTDLFGLRMFSTLVGTAMLVPFYLLVRMWFGVRAALIALTLLSISGVAFHFTKVEFSNIAWPASLVFGFYFLTKGLKSKRSLDFIFSAYSFMFGSLYFYNGGRLTPILLIAVLAYLFVVAPALRLPAAYREIRSLTPIRGRLRAWGGAFRKQALSVLHYFPQVLIFLVAALCAASAFGVYYLDHREMLDLRARDKIIFSNEGLMAGRYGRTHEPLYVGLRWPRPEDIYPISPLVFEQTPLSVKVADDGFWPRVIWDQTTATLSILTYRFDSSSIYTFTGDPVAKPIEAALIILGIAWAAWRWRDTRMAMLSLWFWSAVFAGGVATIDAPYMARMAGVIPVLAIFAAIPLNKLAAELTGALAGFRFRFPTVRIRQRAGQVLGVLGAIALLFYLGLQNWNDYYGRYMGQVPVPFPEVTGQSYFVKQMNAVAQEEGKPKPKYYNLGAHFIYWSHGDNRFLNHGTDGIDMVNASNELPVLDNEDRDIYFMVWAVNRHYLDVIKAYYPDGTEKDYKYGPPGKEAFLFTYYKVTREQLAARRGSTATYTPASGPAMRRDEPGLGTVSPPPAGLTYPSRVTWETQLVAPAFGRYRLGLSVPAEGSLSVDGQPVVTATVESKSGEGELLLARGPHQLTVSAVLSSPQDKVAVEWVAGTGKAGPVPPNYLHNGNARAFFGVITPHSGLPITQVDRPNGAEATVLSARVDGFIGFRDAGNAIGVSGEASWRGTLDLAQAGLYSFEIVSSGPAAVFVDGNLATAIDASSGMAPANSAPGVVELAPGPHNVEVRAQVGGSPYLEVYYTPPGGTRTILRSNALVASGGIIDPRQASEPPPVQLQPDAPPQVRRPSTLLGGSGRLNNPRGLAVDGEGNVYVGDRGNGRVVVYAPDGRELRAWGKAVGSDNPNPGPAEFVEFSDLAVGADGTVYVMDIGASKLQVFTHEGAHKWSLDNSVLQAGSPNGIGIAPDGSLYIASTGQSRIIRVPLTADGNLRPESMVSITGGEEMGHFEQPVDVAPDPSDPNKIYVIDLRNRVAQLNEQGTIVKQWSMQIGLDDGAGRIVVSGDGSTVYVTDPDRNRVAVLQVSDGSVTYFGGTGSDDGQFLGLSGVAVGPNGDLFVLDRRNNRVQVFGSEE